MMIRIAALAALGIGTAIDFATPAWADLQEGDYTATVIASDVFSVGKTDPVTFVSCGEGCMTRVQYGKSFELRLDGNNWVEQEAPGSQCTLTIDNATLIGHATCEGTFVDSQYTKVGG